MASYLVIVESPAKAKTINKYLGKNYTVIASMGHMRDLPKSQLGIDLENNCILVKGNVTLHIPSETRYFQHLT